MKAVLQVRVDRAGTSRPLPGTERGPMWCSEANPEPIGFADVRSGCRPSGVCCKNYSRSQPVACMASVAVFRKLTGTTLALSFHACGQARTEAV